MTINVLCYTNCIPFVKFRKEKKKGQPGALEHMQGPGRGPTIWCIVRSLTLFYTRGCFQVLSFEMTIIFFNVKEAYCITLYNVKLDLLKWVNQHTLYYKPKQHV
jgi:hypothetical protein